MKFSNVDMKLSTFIDVEKAFLINMSISES